jgi:pentapeptide MXKDX repeat protein
MSEQSGFKRKGLWIGIGVVALAVVIVASSGIDFPPGGTSTSGAIVPAQRFRAEQPATTGVSQSGQTDAQRSAQPGTGNLGDARSDSMKSDARNSDALKSDGRQSDAMRSDGRTGDSMKADGRTGDSMKADGRTGDSMKADGRTGDSMKADGRTGDSRVQQ